jgi:hypothetical protein
VYNVVNTNKNSGDYVELLGLYPVGTYFYIEYKQVTFRVRFNEAENSQIRNTTFWKLENGTWIQITTNQDMTPLPANGTTSEPAVPVLLLNQGGSSITDQASGQEWNFGGSVGLVLEDGVPCLDLTAGGLTLNGTGATLGQEYTLVYYWKPKAVTNTWRTLHRNTDDHLVIVNNSATDLGMYSNRNGNFRDTGYNITPGIWQTLIVTSVGDSPTSSTGVGTFYVNDQNVGTVDRVGCGTSLSYIPGSHMQPPGHVAVASVFNRILNRKEITKVHRLLERWGHGQYTQQIPRSLGQASTINRRGLIGWYSGESWTGTQWTDRSGQGNHVTTITGTVTMSTLGGKPILTGTTTTSLTWPSTILPPVYTLFHVAKYNGTSYGRIFNGTDQNWLSGFGGGTQKNAVAHHNAWITNYATKYPNTAWILSTDQNDMYRANKVNYTVGSPGSPSNAQMAVNAGFYIPQESSEWAIAEVMVFDRHLSPSEFMYMEQYLNSKYQLGFPVLQPYLALSAKSLTLADGTTMSSWATTNSQLNVTATGYSAGGASLPTFNAVDKYVELHGVSSSVGSYFNFGSTTWHLETNGGFSFVGYVMFTDVRGWERIFDFGNGPNVDNFLFARVGYSQDIAFGVYTPTTYKQAELVIQNNTWQTFACRYIRGTELAIWVDGQKYIGITSSTHTDKTVTNSYIGRSNWSDEYSALNLRELWWYDYAVSDSDIDSLITQVSSGY